MNALARSVLPLGLTDDEFDAVMRAFYRLVFQREREQDVALCRLEDDGCVCEPMLMERTT